MEPIRPDLEMLRRRAGLPAVAAELNRIGMRSLPALLSTQIAGGELRLPPGAINTEKRPLLEFLAPISFFTHARVRASAMLAGGDSATLLADYRRQSGSKASDELDIARYQWSVADEDLAPTVTALESSLRLAPDDTAALALYATVAGSMGRTDVRLGALRRLAALTTNEPTYMAAYAVELVESKRAIGQELQAADAEAVIALLERCVALTERNDERYLIRLAEIYSIAGRHSDAAGMYEAAVAFRDTYEPMETEISNDELLVRAARESIDGGKHEQAASIVRRLERDYPMSSDLPELRQQLAKDTH
jgi:tetratricopeptide (TPR) repeat protein